MTDVLRRDDIISKPQEGYALFFHDDSTAQTLYVRIGSVPYCYEISAMAVHAAFEGKPEGVTEIEIDTSELKHRSDQIREAMRPVVSGGPAGHSPILGI